MDNGTDRRRRTAPPDNVREHSRSGAGGSRSSRNGQNRARNTNRSRAKQSGSTGDSGRSRRKTGRGMTRQQRQKQLMMHVMIAAVVIIVAVIVIIAGVRASGRPEKSAEAAVSTETSQTAAAAGNAEAAQTGEVSGNAEAAQPAAGTENAAASETAAPAGNQESSAAGNGSTENSAAPQGTAAAASGDSAAAQTGTAAVVTTDTNTERADSSASEKTEEELSSGPGLADQSLVEKLSVEAKKNLETEKIRLAKEEEERQRLAEEAAKKAEVKDRDELSEISIEELAEYLRNKEVPEELVEFMEEYPEAREFVTDYLYQPDPPLSKDISGEVQKGVFPHFLQWDERWGYEDYGGSFFAVAGCGPTAMSVVYSGLTGKTDMNPFKMGEWAEEQGYYIVGEGTSWEMMWSGANSLGLYWWEVDFDEMSIRAALDSGCPIIAAMSPGGDFTTFGHFIVMTDIDDEGNITIRDSNSNERSDRTWTWDELMWQTAAMWAYNYDDGVYDEEVSY